MSKRTIHQIEDTKDHIDMEPTVKRRKIDSDDDDVDIVQSVSPPVINSPDVNIPLLKTIALNRYSTGMNISNLYFLSLSSTLITCLYS